MRFRFTPDWSSGDLRLTGLLIVLTTVPAACVLWFMSTAVASDAVAAEERIRGAYRAQLRLVRDRVDVLWRTQAERLNAPGDPSRAFQRLVSSGVAEGAVLLDESGYVSFPWTDVRGDLADLDMQVAAIGRLDADAREAVVERVAERLNDYGRHLPAGDRLRLMDDLRMLAPGVRLPTHAALQLSLDMVDAERPEPVPDVVRRTSLTDVWALTSTDGRSIGLYRTGRLEAMMHDFLRQVSLDGVAFVAYPPDAAADAEAIAAGPWLPGWQLSFVPLDRTALTNDLRRRRTMDVSVALAGVTLILVVGVLAGRSMRRHLQVARLKTDLVAAASHELRTPLASMRVLVDGLLADRELDPVKTREYLELLASENERLSRSIGNFLAFARLDRGTHRFTLVPVAAGDVVTAAVSAVRTRQPRTDIHVEIEPDLPAALGDREALITAIVNLLDNAAKYSPTAARITVTVRRDGDGIAFTVADHGMGIAPREQRRIFRRFYRVDPHLTNPIPGVGLGLSIVHLIARGHHGEVTVRSEPGIGSAFTLRVKSLAQGAAA